MDCYILIAVAVVVAAGGCWQGKKAYFLSKSAQKQLVLEEKFKALQAKGDGAVDKYLEKKRKKNASKDRRQLPWKRAREGPADADE